MAYLSLLPASMVGMAFRLLLCFRSSQFFNSPKLQQQAEAMRAMQNDLLAARGQPGLAGPRLDPSSASSVARSQLSQGGLAAFRQAMYVVICGILWKSLGFAYFVGYAFGVTGCCGVSAGRQTSYPGSNHFVTRDISDATCKRQHQMHRHRPMLPCGSPDPSPPPITMTNGQ